MPGKSGEETTNKNNVGSFESFLEGWLVCQEHNFDELVTAQQNLHESRDEYLRDLTSRVLSHYQQYYHEKSEEGNRDVFRVVSPPWFTPYERSFFWVAGFKPSIVFRLVERSVGSELTQEQSQRMNELMGETRMEENELEYKMERIQVGVAWPPMVLAARRLRDGETEEGDRVVEDLRATMEGVVVGGDLLWMRTAERVMEILSSAQNVKFLTATTQLQLNIRRWGLQREAVIDVPNGG